MSIFKFTLGETVFIKSCKSQCGKIFTGRESGIITRLGGTIDVNVSDKLYTFYEDDLESSLEHTNNALSGFISALNGVSTGIDLSRHTSPWVLP